MFSRSLVGASRLGSHIYAALVVILVSLLITGLIAGCGAGSPMSTSTPVPTHTPTPTLASTPTPTATPVIISEPTPTPTTVPTPTSRPTPTATAAPTAQPTPTPKALSTYENDIFGVSIAYPEDWDAEFGLDLRVEPLVIATAPEGFPALSLRVRYLPEVGTVEEVAGDYKASLAEGIAGFEVISEEASQTDDGVAVYNMLIDYTLGELPMRSRIKMVLRGSQLVELNAFTLEADFSRWSDVIEEVLQSLSVSPPIPFGIPREEALTVYYVAPLTLDPHKIQDATSYLYASQVFSGLVTLDRDLNVVPDLAEGWEVEDGGTKYIFHLREDARFHDGRQVTAEDVKYSIERATDPMVSRRNTQVYLDDIVGVTEKLAGQAQELRGVEVIDDRTVAIRIDGPKAYFLSKLTHPAAFVVDRRNVEDGGFGWWSEPNGTGPFKIKEWRRGQALAMERNDDYHRGTAKVEYIVFRLHGGLPALMYETGEVDVAWASLGELERVLDPEEPLSDDVMVYPQLSVFYVAMDTTRPPFDDINARRAFALALDRDKIVNEVYNAFVEKAEGFLPPGLPGYDEDLEPLPFDIAQAQELLAETAIDIGDGGTGDSAQQIIYATPGRPGPAEMSMFEQWKENLGVDITVLVLDQQQYYYWDGPAQGHLLDFGWIADYPDPQNFLDVLFHSETPNNLGSYSNPRLDALLEEARTEEDRDRRLSLYRQAEQLLLDDVAAIPLWHGRDYVLVKPYVKDWHLSPQGVPDFLNVKLERE